LLSALSWSQATLPVTRTTWNSTPTGWSDNTAGTFYNTPTACLTTAGRMDTNGHNYVVFFNGAATAVTFVAKPTGATANGLIVEESINGIAWTPLVTIAGAALGTNASCTTHGPFALLSTSRYVRWTYSKTVAQNLMLDDVSITAPTPNP